MSCSKVLDTIIYSNTLPTEGLTVRLSSDPFGWFRCSSMNADTGIRTYSVPKLIALRYSETPQGNEVQLESLSAGDR